MTGRSGSTGTDRIDNEERDSGRRPPVSQDGAVRGSGAPDADPDGDPQGGNGAGVNPTAEGEAQAMRQKGRSTSA